MKLSKYISHMQRGMLFTCLKILMLLNSCFSIHISCSFFVVVPSVFLLPIRASFSSLGFSERENFCVAGVQFSRVLCAVHRCLAEWPGSAGTRWHLQWIIYWFPGQNKGNQQEGCNCFIKPHEQHSGHWSKMPGSCSFSMSGLFPPRAPYFF